MKYNCPKCNEEIIIKSMEDEILCKCGYKPDEKEMKEIYDCYMIEEDMEIWKEVKGIK